MQPQAQPQEPQTISLGEKEYTQEDLSRLVGLGETAAELETKWNTKIDSLMPEYTRATQERKDLQERLTAAEGAIADATRAKAAAGGPLTPEEEARIVREQAEKFGLLTEDKFEAKYQERRESERNQDLANKLIDETTTFLEKKGSEGLPKPDVKEMLTYMDEQGISNYESAYKLKYERELDDWKMKNISANRPNGLYTQSGSGAGAKAPVERQVNSANLSSVIEETLARFG